MITTAEQLSYAIVSNNADKHLLINELEDGSTLIYYKPNDELFVLPLPQSLYSVILQELTSEHLNVQDGKGNLYTVVEFKKWILLSSSLTEEQADEIITKIKKDIQDAINSGAIDETIE